MIRVYTSPLGWFVAYASICFIGNLNFQKIVPT
jgi:hypothetical protein